MEKKIITGIQQLGIGIPNVHEAWAWYRRHFGMDVPIFEEAAEAALMLPYTGGEPRSRHAVLALNMQGGSGFEIWQYTSRTPQPPAFSPELGDTGIFAGRIKSRNVSAAYQDLKSKGANLPGEPTKGPDGKLNFFVQDPYQNIFNVVEGAEFFSEGSHPTAGPAGAMLGVSDIERALPLYQDILGFDEVVYDVEGSFEDFAGLPGGKVKARRVLLTHSQPRQGGFSPMLGKGYLELVCTPERTPRKIFENRMWGDLGFIHLCFDIINMKALREECEVKGYPFTVDSEKALGATFDMGEAAGRFSYIEDPDGTLIEFVETLKVPLIKKLGWYLDMRKRDPKKALPKWMLKSLRFSRVKD